MEKNVKKIVSLLLAVLLLLSCRVGITALGAETGKEQPTVVGTRLSITEDFLAYFYIRLPEGADRPRASVDGVVYEAVATDEAGVYMVTYPHLTVTAMTEEVEVIPACRIGGKTVKGLPYGFSVRDYAMRLLVGGEVSPALRRVLVSMLNFGAAAQVYNSERVYNLANDYLRASDKQVTKREYTSVLQMDGEATQGAASIAGASMYIGGSACLKIYVDLQGQENLRINGGMGFDAWRNLTQNAEAAKLAEGVLLEVADNPAFENASSFTLEKLKQADGYVVITTGIYADQYSRPYYVRLRTAEGVSRVLTYSVETYVARSLAGGMDEDGERLLTTMMEYGDAVVAYRDATTE